jgi:hypothetical protein
MGSFWDNIKKIFQAGGESSPSNPAIHEVIERSEEEKADFALWKETIVCKRLVNWLGDQYALHSVLPGDVDEAIGFLNTPSSKGFVIHFSQMQYSRRDATHLLDLLCERVRVLRYTPQVSDRRTFSRGDWVETVERHYLKPRTDFRKEGPFEQRFGNVMIELVLRDEQPHNLKFSATSYTDSKYRDAEDFQELMQGVMG